MPILNTTLTHDCPKYASVYLAKVTDLVANINTVNSGCIAIPPRQAHKRLTDWAEALGAATSHGSTASNRLLQGGFYYEEAVVNRYECCRHCRCAVIGIHVSHVAPRSPPLHQDKYYVDRLKLAQPQALQLSRARENRGLGSLLSRDSLSGLETKCWTKCAPEIVAGSVVEINSFPCVQTEPKSPLNLPLRGRGRERREYSPVRVRNRLGCCRPSIVYDYRKYLRAGSLAVMLPMFRQVPATR